MGMLSEAQREKLMSDLTPLLGLAKRTIMLPTEVTEARPKALGPRMRKT